ncbi:MAG TPA: polysaccharide deacetylase family protein, partial [Limnochordia bacterium]|nr:polysaccharide deacetylase family protein [Limnochordia bacterium]
MAGNDGWWGEARAAVSLSFDDAAPSQLEHAIPVLDRYGLHGTFYVNPTAGGRFERDIAGWRAARAHGHEVANHTLVHPCSGNFAFIGEERALERWRLEDLERDVLEAGERLRALMGADDPVSFA